MSFNILQDDIGLNIRLLIITDINLFHALRMRSRLLEKIERYDFIILCGPLVEYSKNAKNEVGTIISTVSHFQTVCNKVCYLLTEQDPTDNSYDILTKNIHFNVESKRSFGVTPNSSDISGDKILMNENLYIAGYSETTSLNSGNNDTSSSSSDSDKRNEIVKSEIEHLLMKTIQQNRNDLETDNIKSDDDDDDGDEDDQEDESIIVNNGIFYFDYKYSESLYRFLIHEEFKKFNLRLLIVSAITNDINGLAQICPPDCTLLIIESFNKTGNYYSVSMESKDNIWRVTDIKNHNFNDI